MSELILPHGTRRDTTCPTCGAGKDRRVNAAGFGTPVIVCGKCGYEFTEDSE